RAALRLPAVMDETPPFERAIRCAMILINSHAAVGACALPAAAAGAGESLVVDRVADGPDGLLAVGDSRPGAGWPAIGPATGMDPMADLDRSLGRPYDLGAGKEHQRAIHRLLIRFCTSRRRDLRSRPDHRPQK